MLSSNANSNNNQTATASDAESKNESNMGEAAKPDSEPRQMATTTSQDEITLDEVMKLGSFSNLRYKQQDNSKNYYYDDDDDDDDDDDEPDESGGRVERASIAEEADEEEAEEASNFQIGQDGDAKDSEATAAANDIIAGSLNRLEGMKAVNSIIKVTNIESQPEIDQPLLTQSETGLLEAVLSEFPLPVKGSKSKPGPAHYLVPLEKRSELASDAALLYTPNASRNTLAMSTMSFNLPQESNNDSDSPLSPQAAGIMEEKLAEEEEEDENYDADNNSDIFIHEEHQEEEYESTKRSLKNPLSSTSNNRAHEYDQNALEDMINQFWNPALRKVDTMAINHYIYGTQTPKVLGRKGLARILEQRRKVTRIKQLEQRLSECDREMTILLNSLKQYNTAGKSSSSGKSSSKSSGANLKMIDLHQKVLQKWQEEFNHLQAEIFREREHAGNNRSVLSASSKSAPSPEQRAQILRIVAAYRAAQEKSLHHRRKQEDDRLNDHLVREEDEDAEQEQEQEKNLQNGEGSDASATHEVSKSSARKNNIILDRLRNAEAEAQRAAEEQRERQRNASRALQISLARSRDLLERANQRRREARESKARKIAQEFDSHLTERFTLDRKLYVAGELDRLELAKSIGSDLEKVKANELAILDRIYREEEAKERASKREAVRNRIRKMRNNAQAVATATTTEPVQKKEEPEMRPASSKAKSVEFSIKEDKELSPEGESRQVSASSSRPKSASATKSNASITSTQADLMRPVSGDEKVSDTNNRLPPILFPPGKFTGTSRKHEKSKLAAHNMAASEDPNNQTIGKRAPFTCKPEIVTFSDYENRKKYRQTVILTNVSARVNSFKLACAPSDIISKNDGILLRGEQGSKFRIVYHPPGNLSAGLTCSLVIEFMPGDAQIDLGLEIPFQCDTGGVFKIPVKCTSRKCVPSLQIESYDFETVRVGESSFKTIRLINHGIIPTSYRVVVCDNESDEVKSGGENETSDILYLDDFKPLLPASERTGPGISLIAGDFGTLPGHSFAEIRFQFQPNTVGAFSKQYEIQFPEARNEKGSLSNLKLNLKGMGDLPPIFVSPAGNADEGSVLTSSTPHHLEVGICCEDSPGRSQFTIFNRGSIAYQFRVEPGRPNLAPYFDFSPSMAFVQPGTSPENPGRFEVKIRVKPNSQFLVDQMFNGDEEERRLKGNDDSSDEGEFVLTLLVTFLTLPPIKLKVHGFLTFTDLDITPLQLNFQNCNIDEAVGIPLEIKNPSLLDQEITFLRLPDLITLSNASSQKARHSSSSVISLPAKQSISVSVIFKSQKPGRFKGKIALKSDRQRTFFISYEANVFELLVRMSPLVLQPAPLFHWDWQGVRESIVLSSSYERCKFLFEVPDLSKAGGHGLQLQVYPSRGTLAMHDKVTIWIRVSLLPLDELNGSGYQPVDLIKRKMNAFSIARQQQATETANSEANQSTVNATSPNPGSAGRRKSIAPNSSGKRKPNQNTNSARRKSSVVMSLNPGNNGNNGNSLSSSSGMEGSRIFLASIDPLEDPFVPIRLVADPPVPKLSPIHIPCLFQYETADKPNVPQYGARTLQINLEARPSLFKVTSNSCLNPEANLTVLNFGGCPAKSRAIETLIVKNCTENMLILKLSRHLNPFGPFSVVNALRTISTNSEFTIKVAFEPEKLVTYNDIFQLEAYEKEKDDNDESSSSAVKQRIEFKLTGLGIKGQYEIEGNGIQEIEEEVNPDIDPESIPKKFNLPFGDCALAESIMRELMLKNSCSGRLRCTLQIVDVVRKGGNPGTTTSSPTKGGKSDANAELAWEPVSQNKEAPIFSIKVSESLPDSEESADAVAPLDTQDPKLTNADPSNASKNSIPNVINVIDAGQIKAILSPWKKQNFDLAFTPRDEKYEYEADLRITVDGCHQSIIRLKGKCSKKDKKK